MLKQIVNLPREPFHVDLIDRPVHLFVDPRTGDILYDNAVLRAWKGLVFSLAPAARGQLLRLQYRDITIDIGWTDDAEDAASWVEAVNRFLETKRDAAVPNAQVAQASTGLDFQTRALR